VANDNHNTPDITPAHFDAFAVVVAANVPSAYLERMKAGNLKPAALVFELVTKSGLTAGEPVTAPVRDLLPEEAIAVMQRAMAEGTVQVSVAFQPVRGGAKVHRV